jgi:secreted trypsin-like serine protease
LFINFIKRGKNAADIDVIPNILQQTNLKIYPETNKKVCQYMQPYLYCAKDPNSNIGSNSCQGDSGGPILYYNNDKYYAYGIASFVTINNQTKCMPLEASYYSATPKFIDWIEKEVNW